MKARDIIPDWPRGTSTSKPYESEVPMWRIAADWSEAAERINEFEDNRRYHAAQARMMDDWHRSRSQATSELTHKLFAGELSRPDFTEEMRHSSGSELVDELRGRMKVSTQAIIDGVLSGRHYYEPLEDHTWPTYGGITRNSAPNSSLNSIPNWTPSDKGNITLEELQKQYEKVKHLQPDKMFPPYYRAHPITIANLIRYCDMEPKEPERITFNAVNIHEDTTVPLGEFWPPEGWKADAD